MGSSRLALPVQTQRVAMLTRLLRLDLMHATIPSPHYTAGCVSPRLSDIKPGPNILSLQCRVQHQRRETQISATRW